MRNDKSVHRKDTMSSFQTNPDSKCNILIPVYVSGGTEETARPLLAFDISIVDLYLVRWLEKPLIMRHTRL